MADRSKLADRAANYVGDAIADIRSALVERAWFGYEEFSRSNNSHFYGGPEIEPADNGIEGAASVVAEWSRGDRASYYSSERSPSHDLDRDDEQKRRSERQHDDPDIEFDR